MEKTNYVLGRGKLFFDRFEPGTKVPTRNERYFGNTTECTFSLSSEKLDHFNSDAGVRVKDDSVTLQTDSTGNFICDNINKENLALFFLGDSSTLTVAGGSGIVSAPIASLQLGTYYQIGLAAGNESGARKVSTVVVVANGADTIAASGNFTLDADLGRIYWHEDAADIVDGDALAITYTQVAHTRDQVVSESESIQGALRFVADNPKGSNKDYYIAYCEISPDGDFSLKGDDWQNLGFSIEILQLDEDTPRLLIDGRPAT